VRKAGLAGLLRKPSPGIALNTHYVGHGEIVYQQACELGCEGIVSKRLGSTYRSGRMLQLFLPKISPDNRDSHCLLLPNQLPEDIMSPLRIWRGAPFHKLIAI
jgi:ATP-dependent DNA ligase